MTFRARIHFLYVNCCIFTHESPPVWAYSLPAGTPSCNKRDTLTEHYEIYDGCRNKFKLFFAIPKQWWDTASPARTFKIWYGINKTWNFRCYKTIYLHILLRSYIATNSSLLREFTVFVLIVYIIICYYTVDCTIPKYIWTSAQMNIILDEPIGESNMVKSSWHESKYISVLYSQLYNYLFIIYPTV